MTTPGGQPRTYSRWERALLDGLTPHARLHALDLLEQRRHLRPTSGRRSPEHNRRVGGSPRSWHLLGRALDVVGPIGLRDQDVAFIRRQRVTPRCTGHEELLDEGDHIHVAW